MLSIISRAWQRWRYRCWIARHESRGNDELQLVRASVLNLPKTPFISLLVPVYDTPAVHLQEMIESVRSQLYPHWELCLVDDASRAEHVRPLLQAYADRDARIRVVESSVNGHICAASNMALDMAQGAYVALLDHDDVLSRDALCMLVRWINAMPGARLFYSDEDKLDPKGRRFSPHFKPDWDPDLIVQLNMFSHFGAFETALARSVGGFRLGYEGSQDHDLLLRCVRRAGNEAVAHIPHVLYHWRAAETSTASGPEKKPYAVEASLRAVNDHLRSLGSRERMEDRKVPGLSALSLADPDLDTLPSVRLVVDVRSGGPQVDARLRNLSLTDYPGLRFTVIVSAEALLDVAGWGDARVVRGHGGKHGAMVINEIISGAEEEFVCLVDERTRVSDPSWLRHLARHASMSAGVGACGVRWCNERDRLLNAGLVRSGERFFAARPGRTLNDPGYFGYNLLTRRVTALPDIGTLFRRLPLLEVGGIQRSGNGWITDGAWLCHRMTSAGFHHLVVGDAALTRIGFDRRDIAVASVPLAKSTDHDRHYNTNLSFAGGSASFRMSCSFKGHRLRHPGDS